MKELKPSCPYSRLSFDYFDSCPHITVAAHKCIWDHINLSMSFSWCSSCSLAVMILHSWWAQFWQPTVQKTQGSHYSVPPGEPSPAKGGTRTPADWHFCLSQISALGYIVFTSHVSKLPETDECLNYKNVRFHRLEACFDILVLNLLDGYSGTVSIVRFVLFMFSVAILSLISSHPWLTWAHWNLYKVIKHWPSCVALISFDQLVYFTYWHVYCMAESLLA